MNSFPTGLQKRFISITPDKQRSLIASGQIAAVEQTDEYGRWVYTTVTGQYFSSTISPSANHLIPGMHK
jgi:hypothetical protein